METYLIDNFVFSDLFLLIACVNLHRVSCTKGKCVDCGQYGYQTNL